MRMIFLRTLRLDWLLNRFDGAFVVVLWNLRELDVINFLDDWLMWLGLLGRLCWLGWCGTPPWRDEVEVVVKGRLGNGLSIGLVYGYLFAWVLLVLFMNRLWLDLLIRLLLCRLMLVLLDWLWIISARWFLMNLLSRLGWWLLNFNVLLDRLGAGILLRLFMSFFNCLNCLILIFCLFLNILLSILHLRLYTSVPSLWNEIQIFILDWLINFNLLHWLMNILNRLLNWFNRLNILGRLLDLSDWLRLLLRLLLYLLLCGLDLILDLLGLLMISLRLFFLLLWLYILLRLRNRLRKLVLVRQIFHLMRFRLNYRHFLLDLTRLLLWGLIVRLVSFWVLIFFGLWLCLYRVVVGLDLLSMFGDLGLRLCIILVGWLRIWDWLCLGLYWFLKWLNWLGLRFDRLWLSCWLVSAGVLITCLWFFIRSLFLLLSILKTLSVLMLLTLLILVYLLILLLIFILLPILISNGLLMTWLKFRCLLIAWVVINILNLAISRYSVSPLILSRVPETLDDIFLSILLLLRIQLIPQTVAMIIYFLGLAWFAIFAWWTWWKWPLAEFLVLVMTGFIILVCLGLILVCLKLILISLRLILVVLRFLRLFWLIFRLWLWRLQSVTLLQILEMAWRGRLDCLQQGFMINLLLLLWLVHVVKITLSFDSRLLITLHFTLFCLNIDDMALSLMDVHLSLQGFSLVFLNNTFNNVAAPVMWPLPIVMSFALPILHGQRISLTDW